MRPRLRDIDEPPSILILNSCPTRSEHKVKNGQLHQQLQTSTVNLPLVQVHHILSAVFANKANKYEFLTLAAYLVERLNLLMAASMPQK